jgi:hypothetical protein
MFALTEPTIACHVSRIRYLCPRLRWSGGGIGNHVERKQHESDSSQRGYRSEQCCVVQIRIPVDAAENPLNDEASKPAKNQRVSPG